jgi:hypothetical protein
MSWHVPIEQNVPDGQNCHPSSQHPGPVDPSVGGGASKSPPSVPPSMPVHELLQL